MGRTSQIRFVAAAILATTWIGTVYSQSGVQPAIPQGWTPADAATFYSTPQGSQLIRYSWYLALEQAGSTTPFNTDHLSRYGYLENRNAANPDALPLGFVQDVDREWLGLTCAACHTNEIRSAGKTWR